MIETRILRLSDLPMTSLLFDEYRVFYGQESNLDASRKFISDRLKMRESFLIGVFNNSEQVGFIQLYPVFSSVALKRKLILNDLFVIKSARRSGAATALLKAAIQLARDTDANSLTLQTQYTNTPARILYERCGWKKEQEFIYYNYIL